MLVLNLYNGQKVGVDTALPIQIFLHHEDAD